MKKYLSGVLLVTISTACAVGPNYRRPKVEVPESYRGQKNATETAATPLGDLPWWELFEDEILQGLIKTAIERNKDLRIAAGRIQEARGVYQQTQGNQYPEVGLGAGVNRSWTQKANGVAPNSAGPGTMTSYNVGLDVSYQADLWGQFRRATEASKADLFASEAFRQNVLITLIADVARAYFDLRELDEELIVTRNTVGTRQRSLTLVGHRLKGGIVSLLDVRQSEAELAIAAREVPEIERLIALKENEIRVLLGENPGSVERGKGLRRQKFPPSLPVDFPSVLLERRPDILEAEQKLVAANARIGEAKALFFPQVNLSSFLGMTSIGGPLGATSAAIAVAGNLVQFIFDGNKRRGNYEAAKARFEQALARYEQVIQQSFREVSDALITIQQLKKIVKQQRSLVTAALDGLRLANARYEGGVSSYLEVLEAERQSFNSQLDLVRTERDQLVAVVQLYRALGGGWIAESPTAETQPAVKNNLSPKSDLSSR